MTNYILRDRFGKTFCKYFNYTLGNSFTIVLTVMILIYKFHASERHQCLRSSTATII